MMAVSVQVRARKLAVVKTDFSYTALLTSFLCRKESSGAQQEKTEKKLKKRERSISRELSLLFMCPI